MARKATTKSTTGRGTGSGKARGEQATGTALAEPMPKRGEVVEHGDETRVAERTPGITHDQIAERAQEIWRKRGFPQGEDKDHWYEAERQLRQEKSVR